MAPKDSAFLSLPIELRHPIYCELLISSPEEPTGATILWHDRKGRKQSLSLYPQILRVCKRINAEATPLLYERNKFSLRLTSREPLACGCQLNFERSQSLIQNEDSEGTRRSNRPNYLCPACLQHVTQIERSQALIQDEGSDGTSYFHQPGLLSPSCLQRLAQIEIVVAAKAIWANTKARDIWSGRGHLLVQILQLLADAEVSDVLLKKAALSIIVSKKITDGSGLVLFPRLRGAGGRNSNLATEGEEAMVDTVCPLVERVGKKRVVQVYENLMEQVFHHDHDGPPESRFIHREVPLDNIGSL
ncbi:MAG: hypothetical protein Q9168_007724 [Polycauliona sp. 1 TL-2023]